MYLTIETEMILCKRLQISFKKYNIHFIKCLYLRILSIIKGKNTFYADNGLICADKKVISRQMALNCENFQYCTLRCHMAPYTHAKTDNNTADRVAKLLVIRFKIHTHTNIFTPTAP